MPLYLWHWVWPLGLRLISVGARPDERSGSGAYANLYRPSGRAPTSFFLCSVSCDAYRKSAFSLLDLALDKSFYEAIGLS